MATEGGHVYCTLLMSDSYLPGAVVLARSLKDCGTTKKLAVLVTLDTLLPSTVEELKTIYDYVIPVERISSPVTGNLHLLGRYELRFAFTKIALWRQTQFRKIVYIDADVVALRAPDELFDLEVPFAAAPDIGWPDCFNSGVMLLRPNPLDYDGLQKLAAAGTSFDGADQGLLNEYFGQRPWHRLSFTYNCTPSATYQYEPAYRRYGKNVSMVHFIGRDKPWFQGRGAISHGYNDAYKELLGRWWAVYDKYYVTPTSSAYGQIDPRIKIVSQYVRGEATQSVFGWAATGVPSQESDSGTASHATPGFAAPSFSAPKYEQPSYQPPSRPDVAGPGQQSLEPSSATPATSTEQPMTEPGEQVDNIDQGLTQPVPTVQQRKFSAPHNEWDATRSEPPTKSKPEAQNFPQERYEMSHDPGLFHAPQSYPEPPKDMWYKVPEIMPSLDERPKPIFPWEQTTRPRPTRVFLDDPQPQEPESEPKPAPEVPSTESLPQVPGAWVDTEQNLEPPPMSRLPAPGLTDPSLMSPPASAESSTPISSPQPFVPAPNWDAFSRANAWDEDLTIDRYVRALKISQSRKGNLQVLLPDNNVQEAGESPKLPVGRSTAAGRRESLILTDFPTQDERPSLPVTPAPQRRSTFWGAENEVENSEQMPTAEGVPDQSQWVCPNCGFRCFPASDLVHSSTATTSLSTTTFPPTLAPEPAPASVCVVAAPAGASSLGLATATTIPTTSTATAAPVPTFHPSSYMSVWDQSSNGRGTTMDASKAFSVSPLSPPFSSSSSSKSRSSFAQPKNFSLTSSNDYFKKNPIERIEQLRRSSVIAANQQQVGSSATGSSVQDLPQREVLATAAQIPEPRSPNERAVPWRNVQGLFGVDNTQEKLAEESSNDARMQERGANFSSDVVGAVGLQQGIEKEAQQTETRQSTWRNLEESFSGEHTQEHIEEGTSDLARGLDPDPIEKRQTWQPETNESTWTSTSSTSFSSAAAAFGGEASLLSSLGIDLREATTPDSPQPQRFSSTFTQRSSDELTQNLIRDMETRIREVKETQQRRETRRPRAPTGWSQGSQRIQLEEQEEEEEAMEVYGEEDTEREERMISRSSKRMGEAGGDTREYSEYDIA